MSSVLIVIITIEKGNKIVYIKVAEQSLLLSNVIDADHQNSCLFTNKGHLSTPSWVLIGVLAEFHG